MNSSFSKELPVSKSQSLSAEIQLKTENTRDTLARPSFGKSITDPSQSFQRLSAQRSFCTPRFFEKDKKKLILDLDGTLFAVFGTSPKIPSSKITISVGNKVSTIYVVARKGLEKFLSVLTKFYEISIYTAGYKEFAEAVIRDFNIDCYISKVYHREHCFRDTAGRYIKNLSLIEADLSSSILMEDAECQSQPQPLNTLLVNSFSPEKGDDSDLGDVVPFLIWISEKEDVRPVESFSDEYQQSVKKNYFEVSIEQILAEQEFEVQRSRGESKPLLFASVENFPKVTFQKIDENKRVDRAALRRMKTLHTKIDIGFSAEVRKKILAEKAKLLNGGDVSTKI